METEMQRETWFEETVTPSCLNSRLWTPAPEMTFTAASRAASVTQELPLSPAGCSAGSGTGRRSEFAWFCLSSRRHTVDLGFTSTVIRGPVQPPPTGPCLPTSLRSTVWAASRPPSAGILHDSPPHRSGSEHLTDGSGNLPESSGEAAGP